MAVRTKRLQSALEFVSTYGWAILMLSIVLGVLYAIGVFNLASTGPKICSIPAKIGCLSAYLSPSGLLTVNLQQATQYTINIVSMGCNDQGVVADMIPVLPPVSMPIGGNATLSTECYRTVAGVMTPFSGTVGQSFKGFLIINYTDLTTGFGHSVQGSLIQTVATAQPSGPLGLGALEYLTINVVNSQGTAAPANFQEMISVPASTYSTYEAADLGNVRFSQGSTELYSWCESGCTSGSGSAVFWVNIPSGIAANSNAVINMFFLPTTTEYDGAYAGEAPQLSCNNPANTISGCAAGQYGKYDNGANVFTNYWNFAGTSLPSGWNTYGGGATYSVANGISATGNGNQGGIITTSTYINFNQIADYYSSIGSFSSGYVGVGAGGVIGYCGTSEFRFWAYSCGSTLPYSSAMSIYSSGELTTTVIGSVNYGSWVSLPNQGSPPYQVFIVTASTSPTIYTQYVRTRAYPPGGVMPSTSFGAIS